jgi:hypothetical protein
LEACQLAALLSVSHSMGQCPLVSFYHMFISRVARGRELIPKCPISFPWTVCLVLWHLWSLCSSRALSPSCCALTHCSPSWGSAATTSPSASSSRTVFLACAKQRQRLMSCHLLQSQVGGGSARGVTCGGGGELYKCVLAREVQQMDRSCRPDL